MSSEYTAEVHWSRGDAAFVDRRYSRRHVLRFDGGAEVAGSSSPHVVRSPYSDPAAVDPEEIYVAALASCHMLWFLDLAARRGIVVDRYVDHARGVMAKDARDKLVVTLVTLHPEVRCSGERVPNRDELDALHAAAHDECFLANSVKTEVRCEPVY
jgi:organic hydroperoxide reductase OsmC/OhrA